MDARQIKQYRQTHSSRATQVRRGILIEMQHTSTTRRPTPDRALKSETSISMLFQKVPSLGHPLLPQLSAEVLRSSYPKSRCFMVGMPVCCDASVSWMQQNVESPFVLLAIAVLKANLGSAPIDVSKCGPGLAVQQREHSSATQVSYLVSEVRSSLCRFAQKLLHRRCMLQYHTAGADLSSRETEKRISHLLE